MEKKKLLKVLLLSIGSLIVYFGIDNWDVINWVLEKGNLDPQRGLGFGMFLVFNILKGFLLLFGIISIVFLIIKFFNKK